MKVKKVKIAELHDDPANVRTHSEANLKAIGASLTRFGQQKPIVVDAKNVVRAGNGTLAAAKRLGWEEIAVTVSELQGSEMTAYAIADNRSGELAEWDDKALAEQLAALDEEGIPYDELGFETPDEPVEPDEKDDEVPDDAPAVVKRGEIWKLGNHRVMCGDSTSKDDVDRLMGGEKADMVFTDPPYGVNYEGGHFHSGDVNIKRKREKLAADNSTEIYSKVIPVIAQFCDGPCYTWYADSKGLAVYQAIAEVGEYHTMIVWHKINATYAAMNAQYKQRHEPCVYWKPKGSTLRWCGPTDERTIWELRRDAQNTYHPTQKPVELAERAIGNHKADSVLDLFLGSGSTLIACEKTKRKCYGMEIDPHYCDIIIKRWEDFTGLKAERA